MSETAPETPIAARNWRPRLLIPIPRGPVPQAPPPRERRMVEITIDGKPVSVPEGSTILEAARKTGHRHADALLPGKPHAGERLPRLRGGDGRLAHAGSRLLAQSGTEHGDQDGFRARALVARMVLEFLASSVDLSTAPQFAGYMERYGARPERFGATAATVEQPVKIDNELYVRDYSKCILCYKCVEACGVDAQNTFAIAVAGRGFSAHISTEFEVPLPDSACVYCGNCIGVCPTGALMFKSEYDMRQAGTWDESRQEQTDTICPYCGVGCDLTVHEQDGQIVKVTSPLDHPRDPRQSVHQRPLRLAVCADRAGKGDEAGLSVFLVPVRLAAPMLEGTLALGVVVTVWPLP